MAIVVGPTGSRSSPSTRGLSSVAVMCGSPCGRLLDRRSGPLAQQQLLAGQESGAVDAGARTRARDAYMCASTYPGKRETSGGLQRGLQQQITGGGDAAPD